MRTLSLVGTEKLLRRGGLGEKAVPVGIGGGCGHPVGWRCRGVTWLISACSVYSVDESALIAAAFSFPLSQCPFCASVVAAFTHHGAAADADDCRPR